MSFIQSIKNLLVKRNDGLETLAQSTTILDTRQVATYFQVSLTTVRRKYVAEYGMPHWRVHDKGREGGYRFDLIDVEEWAGNHLDILVSLPIGWAIEKRYDERLAYKQFDYFGALRMQRHYEEDDALLAHHD